MTAPVRLFWLETRRSLTFLVFPVLVALAWLAGFVRQQESTYSIALWPEASEDIGLAALFLGPAAGGLAAWAAGRDRRHGLGDLLQTTSLSPTTRQINQFSATTLWILLAYVVAGLYLGISTAFDATWGGPVLEPMLIGGLAIAAQAAIGYLAGSLSTSPVQSRLTAALVPVVLFIAELAPTLFRGEDRPCGEGCMGSSYPYENLSPVAAIQSVGGSVFWAPPAEIVRASALWFGGLGVVALIFVALRNQPRSLPRWAIGIAAVAAVVVGGRELVPAPVVDTLASSHAIAYEPVCVQRSMPICLHPAYESVLAETADVIDSVVRPLAGIPGAPVRAEQPRPPRAADLPPWAISSTPDTVPAEPVDTDTEARFVAQTVAIGAIRAGSDDPLAITPAQSAIGYWLLRQGGWEPAEEFNPLLQLPGISSAAEYDQTVADILAAADRFGALSPEQQHAWLQANFAALRAGTLGLEDLP